MVLKNLPVWSLWGMKSKPDLVAARAFHPVIWYLKRKKNFSFPTFFFFFFFFYFTLVGPPTFKSGHTHTHTPSSTSFSLYKKCSLLHRVTIGYNMTWPKNPFLTSFAFVLWIGEMFLGLCLRTVKLSGYFILLHQVSFFPLCSPFYILLVHGTVFK